MLKDFHVGMYAIWIHGGYEGSRDILMQVFKAGEERIECTTAPYDFRKQVYMFGSDNIDMFRHVDGASNSGGSIVDFQLYINNLDEDQLEKLHKVMKSRE
jgi:hypothetical protein